MRTIIPDACAKLIKTLPFKLTEREKRGERRTGLKETAAEEAARGEEKKVVLITS